jgi:probable HAF family extracellular repeat protein
MADLGTLGGESSHATSINNRGQIVGWSYIPTPPGGVTYHAFLFDRGVMTDIGGLGTVINSDANAINDAGHVVGTSFTNIGGPQHAFLYRNGVMADLGTLGGGSTSVSAAYGINNAGAVIGKSVFNSASDTRAFLYRNGTMVNLGTLGGDSSAAGGINNRGQIVGASSTSEAQRAFLYENGQMTDLGTLGGRHSAAGDLNERGQIVGSSSIAGSLFNHAFLYENGHMIDLGTLYGSFSYATAINNRGQIVGDSAAQGNPYPYGERRGFLYENGVMTDLNALIPPDSGWTLRFAADINEAGLIVGGGTNPDGQNRAFLLVPNPEPAGTAGAALLGLALLRRQRAQ